MRLAPALLGLLLACGEASDATCEKGWSRAPLGTCAVDLRRPPCDCVNLAQASCCEGDMCCGPEQPDCPLGTPTCTDGLVSCSGTGFLSFQNLCRTP